jgi:hypothetical protein
VALKIKNPPVLVGAVPLFYVQSLTLEEGYEFKQIEDSGFAQGIAPTKKTIGIEAILPGPDRLLLKKALEAMALTSRLFLAAAAPLLAVTGLPVVSGMTISTDMQITSLAFTQSTERRDALHRRAGRCRAGRRHRGRRPGLARSGAGPDFPVVRIRCDTRT